VPIILFEVLVKHDGTKVLSPVFLHKEALCANENVVLVFEKDTPRALAMSLRTFNAMKGAWTWERVDVRKYIIAQSLEELLPTLPVDFSLRWWWEIKSTLRGSQYRDLLTGPHLDHKNMSHVPLCGKWQKQ
jgi:hypothetical protein